MSENCPKQSIQDAIEFYLNMSEAEIKYFFDSLDEVNWR